MKWRLVTEYVGGELAEADVPAAARLAVVEHAGHEGVLVESEGGDEGERGEAERPPHPAQRVGERQHRRPHDRRRQVEPRVPPSPCDPTIRIESVSDCGRDAWGLGVPLDSSTKAAPASALGAGAGLCAPLPAAIAGLPASASNAAGAMV